MIFLESRYEVIAVLNPDLAFKIVMRRRRSFTGKERRRFWLKEYWNISM
jgi:hypothetical protein